MKTDDWAALKGNQPSSVCHIGDYTIITETESYEFHGTDENDARLIAAAPEMLAVLNLLLEFHNEGRIPTSDVLGRVEATIDKAVNG